MTVFPSRFLMKMNVPSHRVPSLTQCESSHSLACTKKEIVRETRQSAVEPGHNEFPKEQWKLQTNARNKINVHGCNKKSICSGTRAGEVAGKQCRLMAGKIGFLCLIYHSLRSLRFKLNISGVHIGAGRQLLILARTTVVCGSH